MVCFTAVLVLRDGCLALGAFITSLTSCMAWYRMLSGLLNWMFYLQETNDFASYNTLLKTLQRDSICDLFHRTLKTADGTFVWDRIHWRV